MPLIVCNMPPSGKMEFSLPINGTTYTFTRNQAGAVVADVKDADVITILAVSHAYQIYEPVVVPSAPAAPAPAPVAPHPSAVARAIAAAEAALKSVFK